MASVFAKGKRLYFSLKVDGRWKSVRTDFFVGQERAAEAMLPKVEARLAAGTAIMGDTGPVTLQGWSVPWLKRRETEVATWKNDETVLRLHVLPTLGAMRLDEVRPRHVVELVKTWRARSGDERMAPKTVYSAYSTLKAFFRDACLEDLLPTSPCVLTKRQLGPKVDGDPEWRPTALFTASELETLISDELVPMDRRVLYALEGVAGLRHGEAAGLLWRNVGAAAATPPLGMLFIAFSYDQPRPKGDICRPVPIHPTLATVLAEWKLHGWAKMMGRQPTADDLVLPLPPTAVSKFGRWRRKGFIFDGLEKDLVALGLRHRRGHDLRRTFISLARSNGADKDILRRATHKPPKEVIEGYTTFDWETVCREVSKLPVQRKGLGRVVAISRALGAKVEKLSTDFLLSASTDDSHSENPVALPGLEPGRGVNRNGF
jgi:integrase